MNGIFCSIGNPISEIPVVIKVVAGGIISEGVNILRVSSTEISRAGCGAGNINRSAGGITTAGSVGDNQANVISARLGIIMNRVG